MLNDLDTWRTAALGLSALGQTLFVLLYLTFPWWRTFLGRALFYKALMLAVLVSLAFFSLFFEFARHDHLFVTLYAALAVGIWWQFVAFLRVKYHTKHSGGYDGPDKRAPSPGGFL